jgi:predicted nucleotidyltransferase
MMNNPVGMGAQDRAERARYENELQRIIQASQKAGLTLRVIGSLAFQMHCPRYGYLQQALGRAYTDIDFAGYRQEAQEIKALMASLGYVENERVSLFSEGNRAIFDHHDSGLYVDVFYDKLDFCHVIYWEGRLDVDAPTIPLAEMLLEKMQIVEINEKDIIDTLMLLLEHPLGEGDVETINLPRIARLCAEDWGLWRTVTMNLDKVARLAQGYEQLSDEHKAHVASQVERALARIEAEPKPLPWRLRARLGDRVKWYKDVDEVG